MRASVVHQRNPLDPAHRVVSELRRPRRVGSLAPRGNAPVIALLNGRPLMRVAWRRRMRDGDTLHFVTLPLGGGGGNGGSNPLRVLLMIGLFAVAGPLATSLTGIAAGATGGAGILFAGARLGIQLAGTSLINALLPPPKSIAGPQPSPTYTLQAQGNTARLEQAIPVQYGRMLSYPDFANQPYWEYAGQDQYLYHLLCLGCGEFDIEDILIEDTSVSAFEEITYEVIAPGGDVTLFPTSVVTSVEVSGQEMGGTADGTWTRFGTTITVTLAAHGYAIGQVKYFNFTTGGATSDVYAIATVATDTFTITVPAVGTSGAVTMSPVVGGIDGFVAAPAGTTAVKIGVDLVLPSGLFHRAGSGRIDALSVTYTVQARRVDNSGAPLAAWITLEAGTITDRTVTPVRKSLTYDLGTPGRYRVRVWRTNVAADAASNGDLLLWGGLRSYMAEPQDRGPVTLIALRMRATNNLSLQASRKIGVIATRKVPVWNGSSWSAPTASRSIAWAIADASRDTDYGAGLADSRVDLAALLALDAVWTARGDNFDGRFDATASWWETVQRIAAVGRAQCFLQGGILRVVRDAPQTIPVALFSMRNIVNGSFSIDYLTESDDTADAVTVSYWDADTWAPQRVTGKVPGSSALKPAKLDFSYGITGRAHGLREATYHAAANRYRRRMVRWATEMEGFIPAIGDLTGVQHDMAGWGQHAEALGWDAGSLTLTLSEPVTVGGSSVVGFRRDDGGLDGPWPVTAGATDYEVVLSSTPGITPHTDGQRRERTHVMFGTTSTWSTMALVTDVTPRGLYEVEIEAVCEDPSVHTAETGVVAPPIVTSDLVRRPKKPRVKDLFARPVPDQAERATFGWQPAAGADFYEVEMAEGDDIDAPVTGWTQVASPTNAQIALRLLHANYTMVRVRGVGDLAGDWIYGTIGDLIADFWLSDATPFWSADGTPFWSA